MTGKRIRRWANTSPDWTGTQSQDLSPLTLILAAFGPGVLAFVAVQTGAGYWTAVVAFVILEAAALSLVRRDYLRRKSAEDTRLQAHQCPRNRADRKYPPGPERVTPPPHHDRGEPSIRDACRRIDLL